MSGALAGLRVLELGQYTSAPFAARMLALLGAEVIKLEPITGDDMRNWAPTIAGEGYFFHLNNSNKKSVTLDFKHPRGAELLWRLIEHTDVLVENFGPGTLARNGFGYDAVNARRPSIVYCSVKGFGSTGALAAKPAFDTIIQAYGAMMATTGPAGAPPLKAGISASDLLGATSALARIVVAIYRQKTTGTGSFLDVSMYDATGFATQTFWPPYLTGGDPARATRQGNRHPLLAPHDVYAARDGSVAIAVETDAQWRALAQLTGGHELAADPRYASAEARRAHADELDRSVAPWAGARSVAAVVTACRDAGVPAAPVLELADAIEQPHARERESLRSAPFRGGEIRLTQLPLRFSESTTPAPEPIGPLGCDNDAVYGTLLGLSANEIADLRAARVI